MGYTIPYHTLFPPTHLRPQADATRIMSALSPLLYPCTHHHSQWSQLAGRSSHSWKQPVSANPCSGPRATTASDNCPRAFNPAASLSPKVVKRILELEFVEMSEMTVDDNTPQTPGRPPAPARLPITDISQWLERYSLMAAVLATRFPEKAPELFAYQATIVWAERNYEGKR